MCSGTIFSSGLETAHFISDGKTALCRDRFLILVKVGTRAFNDDFKRDVGIGSRQQDLVGDFAISLTTSSLVTLLNENELSSGG